MVEGDHYPSSGAYPCLRGQEPTYPQGGHEQSSIAAHTIPAMNLPDFMQGGRGLSVAEGGAAPPGPIPNPVVKRASASGYCGSNAVGDAAAAGRPHPTLESSFVSFPVLGVAGWSSGSSSGS